jgi:hypothetical protein
MGFLCTSKESIFELAVIIQIHPGVLMIILHKLMNFLTFQILFYFLIYNNKFYFILKE